MRFDDFLDHCLSTSDGALLSVVGVPELFKERLFEMASMGLERPSGQSSSALERKLAAQLCQFTSEASRNFDQSLTRLLKRCRPDWFNFDAEVMKELLQARASAAQDEPYSSAACPVERRLAEALHDFKNPRSKRFDEPFVARLRQVVPRWFETKLQRLGRELMELAKAGGEKPSRDSMCATQVELAKALESITRRPAGQGELLEQLRAAAPGWFPRGGGKWSQAAHARQRTTESGANDANDSRADSRLIERLLERAKAGAPRPNKASEDGQEMALAMTLLRLTSPAKDSYDHDLRARLSAIAPAWFTTKNGILLVAPESCAGIPSDEEIELIVGRDRVRNERRFF